MLRKSKEIRPFGFRDKIGYLFGDFGNDFTFILSTVLLMKFYTDVLGVSGSVVGTVMMIARFADGFTDIAMGRICDRGKTRRAGKFKPWILRMCIPVALTSFLMYQSSLIHTPIWFRITWLFATYILWSSVFYTSINIPYGSMASAISPEAGDRQSLSTFRTMGGTLAGLIIGVTIPLYAYENKDGYAVLNGDKATAVAAVFSLLAVLCHFLCYKLVTERVKTPNATGDRSEDTVVEMLKKARKNRPLISIIAASVVMLLAQLTLQNMAAYIYPDFYGTAVAQSVSTIVMMVGMILAATVSKPLAVRFGKAEISVVSNLFAAGVCLILFFARPQNVWVYVAFQGFCWIGLGIFSMVSWALITDVIDDSELKYGRREDGSVYALYSFARKLGQALAAGASGWLLDGIGYSENAAISGEGQSESVLQGIFNISTIVPAIGFSALALILWFWYPLRKKRVEANIKALKEKHRP